MFYQIAADLVLFAHVLFVFFVVFSLFAIILGKLRNWLWVRNPWFRLTHLLAIIVVTAQSWLGLICPLTTLEMTLRAKAGDIIYAGSFVSHWMETLLYYDAPSWVFALVYTSFG